MPIDFKKTTLIESAFTPVSIPKIDPKDIQQLLYHGEFPTYATEVRGTIAETKAFLPEEELALNLFNKQIEQLIAIIENACKKLGIGQDLLENLQTFSERFRARTYYQQQDAKFYIDIKECLEKIAVCLLNVSPKDIEKKHVMINLLNVIHFCSSGIHGHINTATISVLTPDSIEAWLAMFRRTIIRGLADQHIKNKKIPESHSIHVHNVFLRYACDVGWNPYGFETDTIKEIHGTLAEITPEDLPALHEAFFKAYTPTAIMNELATVLTDRIFARIAHNIAKEAKALEEKALEEKAPDPKPYVKVAHQKDLGKLFEGLPFFSTESSIRTIFDVTEFTEEKTRDEKKETKPAKSPPFVVYDGQKLSPKPISMLMATLTNYLIRHGNPLFHYDEKSGYTLVPHSPGISYKHDPDDPLFLTPLTKRVFPAACDRILVSKSEPTIDEMKSDTVMLVPNNRRLTAYWIEDKALMSHYFEDNKVQDIIQKLSGIEAISDNAELMEMVATKYGSFPTADLDISLLKELNIAVPISQVCFKRAYESGRRDFSDCILDGVDFTECNITELTLTKATLNNIKVTPLQYIDLFNTKTSIKKLRYDGKDLTKEMSRILELGGTQKGILLFFAIENNLDGLVTLLLESNADANIVSFNEGNRFTPIHVAARKGQLNIVTALLLHDPNLLEQADAHGQTPLLWAAAQGHLKVVDYLLKNNANVNIFTTSTKTTNHGKTALYWAVENGYAAVVARLIQAGAKTTIAISKAKRQPIHIAVIKGNLAIVQALIENAPGLINQTDLLDETPLIWAAFHGHLAIADYLLTRHANLNAATKYTGKTALYWAVEKGHAEVVARLVQAGATTTIAIGEDKCQPIHMAAKKGYLAIVKILIEKNPSLIDQTDVLGETPLMWAAYRGHLGVVDYLLKNEANIHVVTKAPGTVGHGKTALYWAVESGHAEVVARLVQAGAKTTIAIGEAKRQPIHAAAITGNLAVVKALIENDRSLITQRDAFNQTPLIYAARKGHVEMVDYLITKKTKLNVPTEQLRSDNHGKTALYWATEHGYAKVVASLVAAGAVTTTALGKDKYQPIHIAATKGDLAVLKALIENVPADKVASLVNQKDAFGQTPLMLAAAKGHLELVDYLINKGARLTYATHRPRHIDHGKTALYWAAENGHHAVVGRLIAAADPAVFEASPYMKFHPAHIAAKKGHTEVVKTLIENDSSLIDKVDGRGRTPLLWAVHEGHFEATYYLINKKMSLNPPNSLSDFMFIQQCYKQNFDELYKALSNIASEYKIYLMDNKPQERDPLYTTKLSFIDNIQNRLDSMKNQNMEDQLQTINDIYKLLSTNKNLEKHRDHYGGVMLALFYIMPYLVIASVIILPIAALISQLTYNTVKFWQPKGYKQKEHMLSKITFFKDKTKRLEKSCRIAEDVYRQKKVEVRV